MPVFAEVAAMVPVERVPELMAGHGPSPLVSAQTFWYAANR
jgi:hypothetical protein